MLQIYDTMTRSKRAFNPITPGKVRMYVCGSTVYDYCHIGHGRMFVAFDVVVRYLRYRGFEVSYVRNITDIDDKIINRANENGEDWRALTKRFIDALHDDDQSLGITPPDHEPLATEHMPQIIQMIECLLKNNIAYVAENGDVYYDVTQYSAYGQLANQNLDELQAGARVDIMDVKHNPLDFALWKLAKPNEPAWDSPWGAGRPGWHIECSAMSTHLLGEQFDIHGGGIDLVFPHHQNEIAQSEGCSGHIFVNYWLHNGHVQVNKEKMSKSLGNFFTIRDVLAKYDAEVVRYFLLASHYRSPISYGEDNLQSAQDALTRLYLCLRDLPIGEAPADHPLLEKFTQAMDDDFNTPVALSAIFDLVREINRLREQDATNVASLGGLLKQLLGVLHIAQRDPADYFRGQVDESEVATIETLIAERQQARADKNWSRSDEIRDELLKMGVVLEDKPTGTIWRRVEKAV